MTVTYQNSEDERVEVRRNCGNTSTSNLPEKDVDEALSMADEETTERTGLLPTDPRLPLLRRKMKILLASAYLMIRFSNLVEVRASVLKEIDNLTEQMKVLEDTGVSDDESIIEGDEYIQMQNVNYWSNGQRRSSTQGRNITIWGRYPDYIIARTGELTST